MLNKHALLAESHAYRGTFVTGHVSNIEHWLAEIFVTNNSQLIRQNIYLFIVVTMHFNTTVQTAK